MTAANVPVIDLELQNYIRFMREHADVHFTKEDLAYDTLLYTARYIDNNIRHVRTVESCLRETVQM